MARGKHHNSQSSLIVVYAALTSLLVGCVPVLGLGSNRDSEGLPTGPVSADFVKGRHEAQLIYPGATVIAPLGGGERSNFPDSGKSAAFAGAVLTSPDPPDQIYAWYRERLLAGGWHEAVYPLLSTQTSLQGYSKGQREKFYVAMDDPAKLTRTLGHAVPSDNTVFEFTYLVGPYS